MRSLNPSLQAGRCQMATPKLPLRPLRSLSVPVRAQAPKDAANDPPPAPGLRTVREIDSAVPSPQEPTEASGVAPATPPPSGFVTAVMKPLKDFGFGKKSIWEGGVGLFILSGIALTWVTIQWAKGNVLGKKGQSYQAYFEFPVACGASVGTPVRIRGVQVGSVMNIRPSLERVDVLVEMRDQSTVIPRNSLIEANQSGLVSESLIDITPQLPIPPYAKGPLDPDCEREGMIVCHRGRIVGRPGVSLDDLVYITTKLARQMDASGMDKMFQAAQSASEALEEAKPLIKQAVRLSEEVLPLLRELREGQLVKNVESLTLTAAEAAADIHRLQNQVLTPESVDHLRQSIITLTDTLKHIESISKDFASVTGDRSTQTNLKQLIESLSRLISE